MDKDASIKWVYSVASLVTVDRPKSIVQITSRPCLRFRGKLILSMTFSSGYRSLMIGLPSNYDSCDRNARIDI